MNGFDARGSLRPLGVLLMVLVSCALAACGGGGSGGGDNQVPAAYSISGVITSRMTGAPISGVNVTLSGQSSAATTTGATGAYQFAGLTRGAYTVTPTSVSADFSPTSQPVTIAAANLTDVDFLAVSGMSIAAGVDFLPSTFSSAEQLRASLVLAGDGLFFTDSTDAPLKRVSLTNSAVTSLADRIGTPESVLLVGQTVYWVDGERLNETSLGSGSTTLLASGHRSGAGGDTADIVADGASVYWVNVVNTQGCSPSCTWVIQKVPRVGGTPVTLATVNRRVVALAIDANNVYWEEGSLEPWSAGCQCGSTVKTVPKSGGAVVTLVDGMLNGALPLPPPPLVPGSWYPTGGLALGATQIFFARSGDAGYDILSVAIGGGAVTTLGSVPASGPAGNAITDIRVDATTIYWIDNAAAQLDAMPIGGGSITALASGLAIPDLGHPGALSITAGSAYWSEAGTYSGCCLALGTGAIKRVPLAGGAATTVQSGLDAPVALDVDSTNAVWAESWRIGQGPALGGMRTTIASGVSTNMARIAIAGSNLYVLDGDWIKKMPLAGGTLEKLASAHGGAINDVSQRNQDIATDGANVYWTVGDPIGAPTVWSVAAMGGNPAVLSPGGGTPYPQDCYWRIAVVGSTVYWSSTTTQFPIGCTVRKVPVGGGATTTLVDAPYVQDFTVDATDVYFSEFSTNSPTIKKVPVGGGGQVTVATNALAWVLTNDSTNLYWIDPNSTNGGIGSVPKSQAGGAAPFPILGPLATDPLLAADAIMVDQGTVYWTESVSGNIYAVE